MVKNKKAQTGLIIRIIAGFVIVNSLPFFIINPLNPYAQIAFGFGNFLMILGGLVEWV